MTSDLFNNGYALVVAVANYANIRKLPSIVLKDAADISGLLRSPTYCGYPDSQVLHLVDKQVTADGIRSGLHWLASHTGPDDTALFFFSGHGGHVESGDLAGNYLLPFNTDLKHLKDTTISGMELTKLLRNIKAGRLLVLFDCCHSGGIGETKEAVGSNWPEFKSGLDESLYVDLSKGQGRAIMASSRSGEVSWVLPNMSNSLFTHYLLKALHGEAPTQGDGLVRLFDVFDFVSRNVVACNHLQHPVLKAEIETNFPIALHLGGQKESNAIPDPTREEQTKKPATDRFELVGIRNAEVTYIGGSQVAINNALANYWQDVDFIFREQQELAKRSQDVQIKDLQDVKLTVVRGSQMKLNADALRDKLNILQTILAKSHNVGHKHWQELSTQLDILQKCSIISDANHKEEAIQAVKIIKNIISLAQLDDLWHVEASRLLAELSDHFERPAIS